MLNEKELLERRNYIGGSDVAAVLEVSPWQTPFMLYQEKIGNTIDDKDKSEGSPIDRGNQCEKKIFSFYENVTGNRLLKYPKRLKFYHPEYDFLHVNLDNKVFHKKIIVECKGSTERYKWGQTGTTQIPLYYLTQAAFYCAVTGAERCDIAVLFFSMHYYEELTRQAKLRKCRINKLDYSLFSNEFAVFRYTKDEQLEQMIIDRCVKFWREHVEPRKSPEPTTTQECDILYANTVEKSKIEATTDIKAKLSDLKAAKDRIKQLEKQQENLELTLKKFIGNNELLYERHNNRLLATYKSHSMSRINTPLLKTEQKEIYKQYLKKKPYKKFTIKGLSA